MDYKDHFGFPGSLNARPTVFKVLNNFNNFEPLSTTSLSKILDSDDFSISKGADSNDMMRMDSANSRKAAIAAFVVGGIDSWKLNTIKTGIEKKIRETKEFIKVKFNKPALFQAVIQRNKHDSNIARLDSVEFIMMDEQKEVRSKAKHLKKVHKLCATGEINCATKSSKWNEFAYYENLYILVTK